MTFSEEQTATTSIPTPYGRRWWMHLSILALLNPLECVESLLEVEISHCLRSDRPDQPNRSPPVVENFRLPGVPDCSGAGDWEVRPISEIGHGSM